MKKIVFTGGGTLGHIYPMVPVMKAIKEIYPNSKIIFFGSAFGLEKDFFKDNMLIDEAYWLDISGLKRSLTFKNLIVIKKALNAVKTARNIIQELQADLVIGMGGYISYPVVKAAIKQNIPTIIHEQNSHLGLANRLLIKQVDRALLSFPLPKKYPNAVLVGNPRSSEVISESKKYRIRPKDKPTVLIVGGSRGAEKINDLIINNLYWFKKLPINMTLITGERYYNQHFDKLSKLTNTNLEIIPFCHNLIERIVNSDVVISRSGATTLFELMALQKICILIPSPNVTNNHQLKNALYFKNKGCAIVIEEKILNLQILIDYLETLLYNKKIRESLINNMKKLDLANSCNHFLAIINEYLQS